MKKMTKLLMSAVALMGISMGVQSVQAQSSLDDIIAKGKIVMGTNAEYPPFEWVKMTEGEQQYVGIDFDLAQMIADEIGVELEISDQAFNSLIPSVQTGKIDLAIAGMSYTDERAEQIDFSSTYYQTTNQFVLAAEDDGVYTELADFETLKIGVLKASVQEQLITTELPNAERIAMNKNGDLIEALKVGKVDAVLMDNIVISDYIYKNEGLIVAVEGVELDNGSFDKAVVLAKENHDLLEIVNKVIDEAVASGKMEEIVQQNIELTRSNQE